MQAVLLWCSIICPILMLYILIVAFKQRHSHYPRTAPQVLTPVEYYTMLMRYRNLKRDFKSKGYKIQTGNGHVNDVLLYSLHTVRKRKLTSVDYLDQLFNLYDRMLTEVCRVNYFDPKTDRQNSRIKAELIHHYDMLLSGSPRKIAASQKRISSLSDWKH